VTSAEESKTTEKQNLYVIFGDLYKFPGER
jgi:hypothetical protein